MSSKDLAEKVVRDIRRKTRRKHSTEDKIHIVLEGLRGEESIAALCRREGIAESLYYSWSKEFLEDGRKRLAGDPARQATNNEVKALLAEAHDHPPGRAIPSAGPAGSGQAGHSADNLQSFGLPGLEDRTSGPGRVWNRIPDRVRQEIVELALQEPELSPRESSPTRSVTLSPKPPSIGS